MQFDKCLYMIIENEKVYSSGYAKIMRFKLKQTAQEVLYFVGNEDKVQFLKTWMSMQNDNYSA